MILENQLSWRSNATAILNLETPQTNMLPLRQCLPHSAHSPITNPDSVELWSCALCLKHMFFIFDLQVKTTSPKKYFVRPNTGVIQPWDSCVITGTIHQFVFFLTIMYRCYVTVEIDNFTTGTAMSVPVAFTNQHDQDRPKQCEWQCQIHTQAQPQHHSMILKIIHHQEHTRDRSSRSRMKFVHLQDLHDSSV